MDQSELVIAQIKAEDLIKLFYFASWGLGSLGGIWGHLGSKSKDFQTLTPSFGVKILNLQNKKPLLGPQL